MSANLVSYFTNLVRLVGSSKSHTAGGADPTQVDTFKAYFSLDHGFETPEAGKHNGELCEQCGQVVEDDRCFCTDYAFPMPNLYEVVVTIPCWVTDISITAKTGEVYQFVWDNDSAWSCGSGELAEKMLDTLLSCADASTHAAFVAPPSEFDGADYEMEV